MTTPATTPISTASTASTAIRIASPADARGIAELHVLSWRQAYGELLPAALLAGLSVERRQATWSESLARGVPSVLVAEVDDRIAGFAAFGPCRDRGAERADQELWAIYLASSQWSTGLGRRLWLGSRQAMVERGATRISLWVLAGNRRAIRFYAAAGFQPEPAFTRTLELGGAQVEEVRYVLRDVGQATQGAPGPQFPAHTSST